MTHSMFTDALAETHRHDLLTDAACQRLKRASCGDGNRQRTRILTAGWRVLASLFGGRVMVARGQGSALGELRGAGLTGVDAAGLPASPGLVNRGNRTHLREKVMCAEY